MSDNAVVSAIIKQKRSENAGREVCLCVCEKKIKSNLHDLQTFISLSCSLSLDLMRGEAISSKMKRLSKTFCSSAETIKVFYCLPLSDSILSACVCYNKGELGWLHDFYLILECLFRQYMKNNVYF